MRRGEVYNANGEGADGRRHVVTKTTLVPHQGYITEGIIHDITVVSAESDTDAVKNLTNLQREKSVLKVLCRTVHRKLRTANEQQKNVFQSRLSRRCVKWKHIPALRDSQMMPRRGETFHLDTSATRTINEDTTVSFRRRTYRDGGLKRKISHRQTRNARKLLHHRIGAGVSKRAAENKDPVATATETYHSEGIALTPRTFYTIYNKSSKFFKKNNHFFPVTATTLPTRSPQPPHISEWKTVILRTSPNTNPNAPGDTADSQNIETNIQSPSSVAGASEQTTVPSVASSNEATTAPPLHADWNTDVVGAETSMATATASPLDGSTHNDSSHTQDVVTDTPNPQNYSQNATTTDPDDHDMLQNSTTHGTTVHNDIESEVTKEKVATASIGTTNSTVTIPAATHNANTPTRETSQSTTTFVRSCWLPWEPTSAKKQTPQSDISSTMIPFPSVTNTYVNNVTIAPYVRFSSATIAGMITGSLAIFWMILGPFVCLICHVNDRANKRRQRQQDDKLGHRLVHELIRTEMAKGRGKMYKTNMWDLETGPLPPEPNTYGNNAKRPTCVTVV